MSIVAKKILMGSGAVATPSDDEFNRVNFLSHFDGANNGVNNVFDDGSASNHTMTASGNVTQGSFGPFARPDGEWGVSFDGTGDYLTLPTTLTRLTIANKDSQAATFEAFVFVKAYTANSSDDYKNASIYSKGDVYLNFAITPEGYAELYHYDGSVRILTTSATVPLNTWTHVAVTIAGGVTKIYIGGVLRATGTWYGINATGLTEASRIGRNPASSAVALNAIVSNFRLVEGTAVYTGNFTPPTSKLTAITNTKLLTCQSNRFLDNSGDGLAVAFAGNTAVTAFGPFLTSSVYDPAVNGGSLYNGVDANANYVSAADSADWNLGSGNYTVECWAYGTALGSFNKLVGQWAYADANAGNSWTLETVGNDMEAYAIIGGSLVLVAQGAAFTLNQWHHVALVRNGNNHNIYIDGVAGSTTSNSGTYDDGSGPLEVGSFSQLSGGSWDGYITDVRVVKGTAVYTSNFTPPTAPLTAITNTKLLLNMTDGQAFDSAAQNNLTLVGTAKTSTAQKKFGTASILFDGNSDYAYTTVSTPIGAGDYTIECFVYFNTVKYSGVYQFDNLVLGSQAYHGPVIFIGTSSPFKWATMTQHGSNQSIYSTSGPSADQWYHVANVRTNGVVKIFVDGTQIIDNFNDTTDYSARNKLTLGGFYSSDYYFDGYIDDFRVSQFARYTSNFTAPSEPFADKGQ